MFDLTQIAAQWGDPTDAMFRRVLLIFAGEAAPLCADARAAVLEARRDAAIRAAHTLRGAASNVGAVSLANCAGRLEVAAHDADSAVLEELLADMEAACDATLAVIAAGGPNADES